jgi:hypothetical protein
MPGGKHVRGATKKQNRMYSHILSGYKKKGVPIAVAKSRAAATVNKFRSTLKRRRNSGGSKRRS